LAGFLLKAGQAIFATPAFSRPVSEGSNVSGSSIGKFDSNIEHQLARLKIKMTPLDDYMAENSLTAGFIMVDSDGYEQQFLKGSEKSIRERHQAMILSTCHNYEDFFGIKTLIESWDLGCRFRISNTADGNIVIETDLVCEAA
jgi:hypothetical protein